MAYTNEEIINAYKQYGSVWKAGKHLGLAGQTVHEKLKAIGYKLASSKWTASELTELKDLAQEMTIAEIAHRLGRPYNGVALKISRLGLGNRYGNKQKVKVPRTGEYTKDKIKEYLHSIDNTGVKVTAFAKQKGLKTETLVGAIQRFDQPWWDAYAESHAVKPKTNCPYCQTEFYPLSHKQIYCTRKCSDEARTDNGYFGGRRRETIGLAERTCQLCGRENVKGLSSHHMIGKENDPNNDYLIALCPGCHQIVTILAGRNFSGTPEIWEALIQLVLIRKHGANKDYKGVYCAVDIEMLTEDPEASE
jgi:hypothetical protein